VDSQGQTIFVNTKCTTDEATFTFDIGKSVWKLHGHWAMPFSGHGYYDCGLEGFVGISKHPETIGYLYFCDMTKLRVPPDVKCSKVKVFNKNPAERHLGATFVYMRPVTDPEKNLGG
jgi:hypothetical protein